MDLRVSILDQSVYGVGQDPAAMLRETVEVATLADRLGYHRYWMAEHHSSLGQLGVAPEIMTAAVAATTRRIRVGAAGVMLPNYFPFHVAEQWRLLEALYPGRIDLGLGRAMGEGPIREALSGGLSERREFGDEVRGLLAWLSDDEGARPTHLQGLWSFPKGRAAPPVWMLVSSMRGAALAAELGLPICYNYSDKGEETGPVLQAYRQAFRPSVSLTEPYVCLSVFVIAADDPAAAEHAFWSRTHWRVRLWDKQRVRMLPPDAAAAHPYSEAERDRIAEWRMSYFVGAADKAAHRIRATARRFGADEVLTVTWVHDPAVRRRSVQLMAAAFGLPESG